MSTSLTVLSDEQRGSIAVVGASLSEAVKYPIRELMIAFPSPNISAEERTIQLGIYRDAVLGFEEELVVSVAKWLRFHNPRNTSNYTQPPTPQDVHVAIRNRCEKLARQSVEYFFGVLGYDERGRRRWKRSRDALPNCSRALAEKLATELYKPDEHDDLIDRMTDEAFAELPDAIFGAGNPRDPHIEHRAHLAYLRGLDDDTWHLRRAVLLHDRQCRLLPDCREPRLTEEALMRKTNELIAEFRSQHPKEDDFMHDHRIGEFLRDKGLIIRDDRQLWPLDLRCVPISVLRGEKEDEHVAEIVRLTTARMIGEAS